LFTNVFKDDFYWYNHPNNLQCILASEKFNLAMHWFWSESVISHFSITEGHADKVSRPVDIIWTDHHWSGHTWLYYLGMSGCGWSPPTEE